MCACVRLSTRVCFVLCGLLACVCVYVDVLVNNIYLYNYGCVCVQLG